MTQPHLFQPPIPERLEALRARAIKTRHRHQKRRAKSEAVLAEVLPVIPEAGCSYHVISHGDVDSLSYLAHVVKIWPMDFVLISTWCMAMADLDCLIGWLNTGRIGELDFVLGEIFPTQYPDETDKLHRLEANGDPVKLRIARNHAKITLACNPDEEVYCVIESSANLNTNPRIEQTCITRDRDLFEFYRDFFSGIHSVTRNSYA